MLLDLNCRKAAGFLGPLIEQTRRGEPIRKQLEKYAADNGLQI
jgi:hypothetical protein